MSSSRRSARPVPRGTWTTASAAISASSGIIRKSEGVQPFEIEPVPTGALLGVNRLHTTLDAAMSAIATRMGGACELDSQDWD
jgi:hypothetical protein